MLGETVTNVPPTPTFNPVSPTSIPFPTVRIPTVPLNIKFDEVAKSPESLYKTLPLLPGGLTVIVAAIPKATAFAAIELPTKFSWVILLTDPTNDPSSYTLIDPGINPPPTGVQYLSPGLERTDTIWYWVPAGIPGVPEAVGGSPILGSAWSKPRYWYLSSVSLLCGVLFTLPLRYLGIIIF